MTTKKYSIITGFLGGIRNRYMVYQDNRTLEEKFELASRIKGLAGLELCYPEDFGDLGLLKELLEKYSLGVSAVNFRSRRTGQWMRGSFSSAMEEERAAVVEDLKAAMDCARMLGCQRITTCPLNEGHDYILEMDYFKAYDYFEDSIAKEASWAPEVKISIEYKWNDPRARCFLGNAGETLAFCQRLGMPNVGVTLDVGHSIQAGERPAQSAVMLARANRLFHVHLNDNDKFWDWDMLPGAYNVWDFVEFFYYLRKIGYDDWFAYDIFPKESDTKDSFGAAFEITDKLMDIAGRIREEDVVRLHEARNPVKSTKYLFSLLK